MNIFVIRNDKVLNYFRLSKYKYMSQITVSLHNTFEKFANVATKATGSTGAFIIACLIILIWAIIGPVFRFSNTWQLVINTGTSVATFLMVFLIQKGQNKDSLAI